MSDNSMYTPEQRQQIVTAAIASTDVKPDMSPEDWQRAVIRRATTIQKMRFYNDDSILMQVLDSVRIRARIISVEYEESSTRYLIKFKAIPRDNNEDFEPQEETIRTQRTDGYGGRIIEQDIARLQKIAGTDAQVIIFKHNDMPTEEKQRKARQEGKMIPQQGYRQAIWFEFI